MIKLTLLFVSLILLMINIGCSPVGILASGGGATMVIAEGDRSLGTVVDDATIKLNLSAKFLKSEKVLHSILSRRLVARKEILKNKKLKF